MDVIGFVCVSLGNSTVQLYDSLGSRRACACSEAGFSSKNGDRAWRVYYQRAAFSCLFFYGQEDSMPRMLMKKCFLFMVGSVCRVKQSQLGREILWRTFKSRRWWPTRCGSGWDNSQKTSVFRVSTHWESDGTSVSKLVDDMSRKKCFFQVRISHVLGLVSICDVLIDSPSHA
jgi:hypothetical protein